MRTAVATSHLRITPGKPVVLDVDVTNTTDIIDGVTATIEGLDPAWVSLVMPVVSLFPEASSTLSLKIDLPTNCLAGEYLVRVRVVSIIDPSRFSDHEFWLSVEPLLAASLTLHPSVVIGGAHAVFQASIANDGNVSADLVVNCIDETRQLNCVAYPATVSVPPGETHTVEIHVDGKRPWFGEPVSRNVAIEASGSNQDGTALVLPAVATFTQKPRIPRGALTILILAAIVALWATVFLLVVGALRDKPDPTKAVATNFNDAGAASDTVDLAAVAVAMSGQVTSQSTGEPLPRITVQAFRVKKPSGQQILSGSAATGDDGSFVLESLLPGSYTLQFSAVGFADVWYPAGDSRSAAVPIEITPKTTPKKDLQVVMLGQSGSMSGQIVAPESEGAAAAIAVTLTRTVDDVPVDDPKDAIVDDTGTFSASGLVTPATYTVKIVAAGFDPRTFDETLEAGENKVINTVTLGAATGGFEGSVVTADGIGLGNVEITVSSGEFTKTTKTPTVDNPGQFRIDGLETPSTYTITFTHDGYSPQTIAVELGSGDTKVLPPVILTGGQGTVSGRVTDTSGTPLGGVDVGVACGAFTATTSTLTTSADTTQAGTYTVSDVPTPSACTITFSADGYTSQTIRAAVAGTEPVPGLDVTLPKATGEVGGTVFSGSTAMSDVIVELSNGSAPRSTVTATAPAGAYRFADVEPGDYTLTFRKAGAATRVVIVTIAADQTVVRDIALPAGS
jgi:hypothetical protein